ncbi:MAG: hypothetical protein GTO14_25600 [Anaerolineales bacterium]|nr:hypothetical protein [Anaerolineales bacterium]
MTDQERHEQEEKFEEKFDRGWMDEKWVDKTQEKPVGKRWEEKWSRDPLSSFVWATILIWAGVAFLVWNLGLLDDIRLPSGANAWSFALAGAGLILLGEVVIRLFVPAYSGPVGGRLVLGIILFGIGLGEITGSELVWPLVIIVAGLSILFRGFLRRS